MRAGRQADSSRQIERQRVKDKARECGSLVPQFTSSPPAVSCDTHAMAPDSRRYFQAVILLPSGHTSTERAMGQNTRGLFQCWNSGVQCESLLSGYTVSLFSFSQAGQLRANLLAVAALVKG